MDDGRRFLRYVVPGTVFLLEVWLLTWSLVPDETLKRTAGVLGQHTDLGTVLAAFVASGAIGFMLSALHHSVAWLVRVTPDYGPTIRDLKISEDQLARFHVKSRYRGRLGAWALHMVMWHERVKEGDSKIGSANARADSLGDLMHSMGTSSVGLVLAFVTAVCVVAPRVGIVPRWLDRWLFLAITFVLGVAYASGYFRVRWLLERLGDQVLRDALDSNGAARAAGLSGAMPPGPGASGAAV